MHKGVKKVRKSIEQRKKLRGGIPKENVQRHIFTGLPEEEEKHGYYPVFTETNGLDEKGEIRSFASGIVLRALISVMLFFSVAILWQMDSTGFSGAKARTSHALNEEFPFAKVNVWYKETFGSPLAFTPQNLENGSNDDSLALPVSGTITEPFNGKGIMIKPENTAVVSVLNEGMVIFAGNDRETNKTVIVQHADDSISSYGFLSEIDVHLYQYVATNQRIGQIAPTEENAMVYFAIEKNHNYVDPIQVIQVDDTP